MLVLDDYHSLPLAAELHAVLAAGAEELPPGATLLVTSRGEPPSSWARLRVHGQVEVLAPSELLLTARESAAIIGLRTGRKGAATTGQAELANGWAAGLVLLLEAGPDRRAFPDDHLVFDYLAAEVFARSDPKTRSVLLATSVLSEVTDDLALRLSGVASAGQILAALARRGYFVTRLEGLGATYRYHPLFHRFLARSLAADPEQGLR